MKRIIFALISYLSFSFVFASSCVDLPVNVYRFQETDSVRLVQNFLYEKGYLKAKPNGYFGGWTYSAVKAYQKAAGLSQTGNVGPATRALFKKESCTAVSASAAGSASQVAQVTQPVTQTQVTQKVVTASVAPVSTLSPSAKRNTTRKNDVGKLLQALHDYLSDHYGTTFTNASGVPVELCIVPDSFIATGTPTGGSETQAATLVVPASPCAPYIDVTNLSRYLSWIPRDPNLATSTSLIGYTMTRSPSNDISIIAKNAEDGSTIKASCSFNGFCKDIAYVSGIVYDKPVVTSVSRSTFLQDSTSVAAVVVTGTGFTASNTLVLLSSYSSKEYIITTVPSTGATSLSEGTSITFDGNVLNRPLSCGKGCSQKLPVGEYTLVVRNEGGESNVSPVTIKSYMSSTISTEYGAVSPTAKNVRVGSIIISSPIEVTLTSASFTSTSTSKRLPSNIVKLVLKDQLSGSSFTGSGSSVALGGIKLGAGQSKTYDVYVDVNALTIQDTGFITYGGTLLVNDPVQKVDMTIPVKEFSFTVSY